MRGRSWLAVLALGGVTASVGCELPTESGGGGSKSTNSICVDLIYPCKDDNGANIVAPGRMRRLRVTTVTTGSPLHSTVLYKLNVRNDVGGAGWFISPNKSWIYVWGGNPPGEADHLVELSDVPTNCVVQGANPRTVTIPRTTIEEFQASPVETTFEVVCS
jgi:hypothetical protein